MKIVISKKVKLVISKMEKEILKFIQILRRLQIHYQCWEEMHKSLETKIMELIRKVIAVAIGLLFLQRIALRDTIIPISEIKRASNSDILDYCKRHNIACIEDKAGQTILKGREHVIIHGNRWTNTKNKTTGSLIELVSLHESTSFLGAIAKITGNKNLFLLEQHFGEVQKTYKPFYIPKIKAESPHIAETRLSNSLDIIRSTRIWPMIFLSKKECKSIKKVPFGFTLTKTKKRPFSTHRPRITATKLNTTDDKRLHLWSLPLMEDVSLFTWIFFTFLGLMEEKYRAECQSPPLVLKGLDEQAFHIFLATSPHIKNLDFVNSEDQEQQTSKKDRGFFDKKSFIDRQKNQLETFDISVSTISIEKAMTRDRGLII